MKSVRRIWNFLQEDSWPSFAVTLILAFVVIKFVFFPGLSFLTGTSLPLVIVESCSMYHHEDGFAQSFESSVYDDYGLGLEDTANWDFQNGFSKGDVIFVVGADDIDVGDVIIFNAGARYPLIHRVIESPGDDSSPIRDDPTGPGEPDGESYATKGDNYRTNSLQLDSEKSISEDQLVGKALFRIPAIGWAKLIFFEAGRSSRDRGMCW